MEVGLACIRKCAPHAEAAAAALAGAGCAVQPLRSFLNEAMLDGMCRFFEARLYNDLMQFFAGRARAGPAVRRRMVQLARGATSLGAR